MYYYDDQGRMRQSVERNHLGGLDRYTHTYTFTGLVLSTLHTHQATLGGATTTLQTSYTYDHRERLIDTRRQVNSDTEFIESRQGYNQVGQLVSRSLHGHLSGSSFLSTQSLHYNERGWLSKQSSALFTQELRYQNPSSGITPQYNGNIAEQRWGYSSSTPESFRYSYDKLGRLLDGQSISSAMHEELSYDKMGNIQSLQRDGATAITYHYTGNRLNSISGGLSGSYSYDAIGNALTDRSGFTYTYNHLNQPSTISKTGVSISYSYDALGNKRKSVGAIGTGITQDYLPGGIEYTNGILDRIATAEGYITFSGSTPVYQYYLRDHLGNVRTVFSASGGTATVIQQQDYYPFGLRKSLAGSGVNAYLYNGKELQGELGQYDYGARFYDPVIGRWNVVDPLAEKYPNISPYTYVANNPINAIDPDGRRIIFINGKLGAGSPKGGKAYWNDSFVQGAKEYLHDNNTYFVNTDYSYFSSAKTRTSQGYEWAKNNYASLIDGMAEDEAFNMVSHSMGGAFSKGVEQYLEEQGWTVQTNVMINTFQVDDIKVEDNDGTYNIDYQNTDDPVLFWADKNIGKGKLEKANATVREKSEQKKTSYKHRSPIDGGRKFWDNLDRKIIETEKRKQEQE